MTERRSKYSIPAAFVSFTLPILWACVMPFIGFGDPSGDSAAIQGFLATVMALPLVFVAQVINYQILGWWHYRRGQPKKKYCRIMASVLSFPLAVLAAIISFISTSNGEATLMAALGALYGFSLMFSFQWLSFYSGAIAQFHWISENITSCSCATPQRGAA